MTLTPEQKEARRKGIGGSGGCVMRIPTNTPADNAFEAWWATTQNGSMPRSKYLARKAWHAALIYRAYRWNEGPPC